ncbi:hypothetical protein FHS00_000426 [Limimaricola variabilis]|uniref:Polysaccharide pyruvyl transferase n=1 Tax=Limimaricola variabilis TaxID=1492771 RepID=A0ABR6HKB1_9RHOB|nr:hypothetical protein [Limimaricola variabilis]MBB3710873.1 hypothetical protein [Limimaricola variabilis]
MRHITAGRVTFAHKADAEPPNIGDILCSPRHYFDFSFEGPGRVLVVGGGAIPDPLAADGGNEFAHRLVWATGASRPFYPRPKDRIRAIQHRLREGASQRRWPDALVGSRDPDAAGADALPCPSCFHEVCDTPRGAGIGVILNANPRVSGGGLPDWLGQEHPGLLLGSNAISEADLLAFFGATRRIVTNSYHMAYWSLLSGGEVAILGHSSKLASLLTLFGLDPQQIHRYPQADYRRMEAALRDALDRGPWLSLKVPAATREDFRARNMDFAARATRTVPGLRITRR